ncbi:MAG: class I SAM-dependent methyltransferase [Candidatus Altiarchaeota archaeon]
MNNKLYDSIPAGYYHRAMLEGSNIQRFWHRNKFREVLSRVKLSGGESILDLGCGPGTLLSLIPKNYSTAVGVDISEKQIEYAKKNFKDASWITGTVKDLKQKPEFDFVFVVEVLEHMPLEQVKSTLESIGRILKKNGRIIITTPNSHSLWPVMEWLWNKVSEVKYQEQHITKFSRRETERLLEGADFRIQEYRTIFVLSPFVAIVSPKLAEKILAFEKKLVKKLGALQIIEAVKG